MPIYRVNVTVETESKVDPEELAAHMAVAARFYNLRHPGPTLAPKGFVKITATCRGKKYTSKRKG